MENKNTNKSTESFKNQDDKILIHPLPSTFASILAASLPQLLKQPLL
jgi:hypothetical protein